MCEGLPCVENFHYHGLQYGASLGSMIARILFRTEIQVVREFEMKAWESLPRCDAALSTPLVQSLMRLEDFLWDSS